MSGTGKDERRMTRAEVRFLALILETVLKRSAYVRNRRSNGPDIDQREGSGSRSTALQFQPHP